MIYSCNILSIFADQQSNFVFINFSNAKCRKLVIVGTDKSIYPFKINTPNVKTSVKCAYKLRWPMAGTLRSFDMNDSFNALSAKSFISSSLKPKICYSFLLKLYVPISCGLKVINTTIIQNICILC